MCVHAHGSLGSVMSDCCAPLTTSETVPAMVATSGTTPTCLRDAIMRYFAASNGQYVCLYTSIGELILVTENIHTAKALGML